MRRSSPATARRAEEGRRADVPGSPQKRMRVLARQAAGQPRQPGHARRADQPLDMESIESLTEAKIRAFLRALIVTLFERVLHAAAWRCVFDRGRATWFDGTYRDFLDRVGWARRLRQAVEGAEAEDRAERTSGRCTPRPRAASAASSRPRCRRSPMPIVEDHPVEGVDVRHQNQADRKARRHVDQGAEAVREDHQELAEAATAPSRTTGSRRLSTDSAELRKQIDAEFAQRAEVQTDHDWKAREFDERALPGLAVDSSHVAPSADRHHVRAVRDARRSVGPALKQRRTRASRGSAPPPSRRSDRPSRRPTRRRARADAGGGRTRHARVEEDRAPRAPSRAVAKPEARSKRRSWRHSQTRRSRACRGSGWLPSLSGVIARRRGAPRPPPRSRSFSFAQ